MSESQPLHSTLRLKRLGIDTHQETVIFMHRDCHVCRAEGFSAHARIYVTLNGKSIVATLNHITDHLVSPGEASLSESAWARLDAVDGDIVTVTHAPPVDSLSSVRAKVYGKTLDDNAFAEIIGDIVAGRYSDIYLSSFITACCSSGLNDAETLSLTQAMLQAGQRIDWGMTPVADKHCVGGLPGNRTTPIVVAIVAASGITMPKTSSRAITSPAGTADMMETLAPVDLSLPAMRHVVEQEGGCIVWGGAVDLSPADDILIRAEQALDLDSEGQLVASVLSKKAAAGASHLVLDVPVGPTAKVRSEKDAAALGGRLRTVASALSINTQILQSNGEQPVGNGIGPALEARDVLNVLQGKPDAPADLRARAVALAGALLDLTGTVNTRGVEEAETALNNGRAWTKFQQICEAQGGMRDLKEAPHRQPVVAPASGKITSVDNRILSRAAKLAGAPDDKAAGLELAVRLGAAVAAGDPLYWVHAESPGELAYALEFIESHDPIFSIEAE